MAETSSEPQIDISVRSFIESLLNSMPAPRKFEQVCHLPSLQVDVHGPHDVVFGQGIPIVQGVQHSIPGPGGVVEISPPTSESGDALNEQLSLLQGEALDIEALCLVLEIPEIPDNAMTSLHYWRTVKSLRDILRLQTAPHKIPNGAAYARILLRLAESLTPLLDPEPAQLPLRPLGHVECLDSLVEDMEKGFSLIQQTGLEDDVYIFRDKEPLGYSERLKSLASQIRGD